MKISGLQKLTLLDFPGKTACTVFTSGCNFRCPFCHNSILIPFENESLISEDEFFAFLAKRHRLLDGVCITGGEPLFQKDIADFCRRIKDEGFLVKLDTNGSLPERLSYLIENRLIDYVAMDLKNSKEKYAETIGVEDFDISPIEKSVEILMKSDIPYEFRTTVVREYHDRESLLSAAKWIKGARAYYLQAFKDSENVIEKNLTSFEKGELEAFKSEIAQFVENTEIRGL